MLWKCLSRRIFVVLKSHLKKCGKLITKLEYQRNPKGKENSRPHLFFITHIIFYHSFFIFTTTLTHCVKSVRIWSNYGPHFSRIFPHSDWIRTDTPYLSVFSPNAGKCEKMRTRITSNTDTFYVVTVSNRKIWFFKRYIWYSDFYISFIMKSKNPRKKYTHSIL